MNDSLYITEKDRYLIAKVIDNLPHAILLIGYLGCNSTKVNQYLIDQLKLKFSVNVINLALEEGKSSISIQTIRELYSKTKTGRRGNEILIIQVDSADLIGVEAQNALLKLLEEPPSGVYFLLATNCEDALLPTIHSRAFKLQLKTPKKIEVFEKINSKLSKENLQKLWMLSGERIDIFEALATGDENIINKLNDAKHYASAASGAQKAEVIIKYSDDYKKIIDFSECVMGIYKSLFNYFIELGQMKKAISISKKITSISEIILDAKKLNLNKRVIQIMMLSKV